MAGTSKIEWTDATWNPVTGCTKISAGCDHCYAERFAERFRNVPDHPYTQGFDLRLHPKRLDQPHRWVKPRRIFVNSMSDLFHTGIATGFIDEVFDTMEAADHHIYQVLSKRSGRMNRYLNRRYRTGPAPGHIWCGVSVEDAQNKIRIRHLQHSSATVRFLSIEPAPRGLGPPGPQRDPVGHHRRRKRAAGASHGRRLGTRHPGPVRKRRSPVLLQAVGRTTPEIKRPPAGRS